ncbi:MAG TPA: aminotransferase class I/II-fold pyridoxal phosphate-dependent enzyme, partial [Candidatus Cryptobacteroides sp.]|nr:aminotransferase class I/II-fold pyridoxal phosphate-dependent enzyme [Candidatus Cryptobacteroides sp.]
LIMGTFSKSFGSLGGFIAGSSNVMNYIKHNARSLIFSASMPPANVAAVSKAIDIMLSEPERIENLWKLTRHAQEEFRKRGFDIGRTESPIIPLFVRDTVKALTAVRLALDEGIFITPVVPPAVPQDSVIIRFALMATHSMEQLDEAIEKITKIFRQLEIIA